MIEVDTDALTQTAITELEAALKDLQALVTALGVAK